MPAGRPSLPTLPKGFKTRGLSFGNGAIVKPQVDYESQRDKARRSDREAKEADAANESDQESTDDEKSECSSDSNKSDCKIVEDGSKSQSSHDSQVKEGEADTLTTVKSKRKRSKKNKRKEKAKVKPSKRNNWLKSYELRFGTWIKKIPYKDENGQTRYRAGCIPCEKKGKTRGLGAKPTKQLKTSTFTDHARSQEHKDAVKAVKEDHLRQKKDRGDSFEACWQNAMTSPEIKRYIPEYCKLARLYMAMPTTSVENERHFSLMKFIRNARRNALGVESLNAIMRIKRSSYNLLNFPYKACLDLWRKDKNRRNEDA